MYPFDFHTSDTFHFHFGLSANAGFQGDLHLLRSIKKVRVIPYTVKSRGVAVRGAHTTVY